MASNKLNPEEQKQEQEQEQEQEQSKNELVNIFARQCPGSYLYKAIASELAKQKNQALRKNLK